MRILLIEDDAILGDAVRDHIVAQGHAVDWATDLSGGRDCLGVVGYDLLLLDLQLPDGRGLDLLKEMRRSGNRTAVIILTARDQLSDRIVGLNSGADDYLVKPFELAELSARLAAVMRRYAGNPNPTISVGNLSVDLVKRTVLTDGREIQLSGREWAVLDQLLHRPDAVVAKRQIEDALYAFGAEIESNTVEVYVSRLRKKLGRDAIRTLRGVGYRIGKE